MAYSFDPILPLHELKNLITDVADFPQSGIVFKDITPLLESPPAFFSTIHHFIESVDEPIDKIMAIESRGFIFGSALAQKVGAGLVLVRKPGKLPRKTVSYSYSLEYGQDTLEIHESAIQPNEKVLIVDDVLATGGTAQAAEHLAQKVGAQVIGHRFLIEIEALKGKERLKAPYMSFLNF